MNKFLSFSALMLSLILSSCSITASLASDTTSGTLPEETDLRKTHTLTSSNQTSEQLQCSYTELSYKSDKNVTRVRVFGLGERPSQVEVTRNLAGSVSKGVLPSFDAQTAAGGWNVMGHVLDCSVFGCAAGDYSVLVSYSASFSSCPLALSLEVEVPPN